MRLRSPLELNDDGKTVSVTLIAQVGDVFHPVGANELGNLLNQASFVDLVWNLADNDAMAISLHLLNAGHGSDHDPPLAGAVCGLDAFAAQDETSGGEVRAFDKLQ